MRKIAFLIFSLFFFLGCKSTQPTYNSLMKTTSHVYSNVVFEPNSNDKELENNLYLEITPIDASSINKLTILAAQRDGNYEKEFAQAEARLQSSISQKTNSQRNEIQGKLKAIELVNNESSIGNIPSKVAYQFKRRILYGIKEGRNGSELESLSNIETYSDYYNPYKLNNRYLSVFKLNIQNKSDDIVKIKAENFRVQCNSELLFPLSTGYFEQNLSKQKEKINNVYRLNLPSELLITPKQTITKYFAVPAINTLSNSLSVEYINDQSVKSFAFKVSQNSFSEKYELEQFRIYPPRNSDRFNSFKFYVVIAFEDGQVYSLENNETFLDANRKASMSNIYTILIFPNGKVELDKLENYRFLEARKNKVIIP